MLLLTEKLPKRELSSLSKVPLWNEVRASSVHLLKTKSWTSVTVAKGFIKVVDEKVNIIYYYLLYRIQYTHKTNILLFR